MPGERLVSGCAPPGQLDAVDLVIKTVKLSLHKFSTASYCLFASNGSIRTRKLGSPGLTGQLDSKSACKIFGSIQL